MTGGISTVGALTRSDRRALRALLIAATAAASRPRVQNALPALVSEAPMAALPAAAALHRVSGTVLRSLDTVDRLPAEVRAELLADRTGAALRHLVTIGALSEIGRVFDEAGLSWVVIKGPVLAGHFYPDAGDRSYADLDILVDRRDFPQAVRVLEELGYQHCVHNWLLAEEMLAGQVGMKTPMLSIDLHWHLHYSREDRRPFALDPEAMVGRARRVVVSGVDVPTLDPVDTVLVLAFHAARSDGHRLVWFKDLERVLAVDQPDLDELVRRCHAYRCSPPVGVILARTRGLLSVPVPDDIIHALTPATFRVLDRIACSVAHPVQMHERSTTTRVYTRSVRSSVVSTLCAVPERTARRLQRVVRPPRVNETDDLIEKEHFLQAVTTSIHGPTSCARPGH